MLPEKIVTDDGPNLFQQSQKLSLRKWSKTYFSGAMPPSLNGQERGKRGEISANPKKKSKKASVKKVTSLPMSQNLFVIIKRLLE